MDEAIKELPIGVFDSGVGGISVLAKLVNTLPNEKFIYFADSKYAPYGMRSVDEVQQLSLRAVDFLCDQGIKALVVACNTATSVAIKKLREKLNIPVIGMEPAVKPAVELGSEGKIVVMATPLTLSLQKFNILLHRFGDQAEIIPLPCPGLVELIESGHTSGKVITNYLSELFAEVKGDNLSSVVLGCTHYIFIRSEVARILRPGVEIIDGNCGTVKYLHRILAEQGLLRGNRAEGSAGSVSDADIRFYTSGEEGKVLPLCRKLLREVLAGKSV
ncbi:MAG: glutamate racemase [Carboxydocellales bacterium]